MSDEHRRNAEAVKQLFDTLAPHTRKDVGYRVRIAREQLAMSQSELADLLDRRQAYVSDLENAKTEPTLLILMKLGYIFRKPILWFLPENMRDFTGEERQLNRDDLSTEERELIEAVREMEPYESLDAVTNLIRSHTTYKRRILGE